MKSSWGTQLKHSNIISIFDSAQTAEGRQYAVMDAHQKGVIHRELKPSNIWGDADGNPKVLTSRPSTVEGRRSV